MSEKCVRYLKVYFFILHLASYWIYQTDISYNLTPDQPDGPTLY